MTSLTVGALIIATGLFFGAQYYHDYVEDQSLNAQLWPKLPDPQLTPDARTEIDLLRKTHHNLIRMWAD